MNQSLIGLKISGQESGLENKEDGTGQYKEGIVIDTYCSPERWYFFYFVCVDDNGNCFLINQIGARIDMGSLKKIIEKSEKLEKDIEEIKNRFEILDIR